MSKNTEYSMKSIRLTLLCAFMIMIGVVKAHATTEEILANADSAYAADDYGYAIASYQEALRADGSSPQLFYNLGNAYYRAGKPGLAIVSYERALRLDPSYSDASFNLDFVRSRLVDRQQPDSSVFTTFLDSVLSLMPSNYWAWLGATFFVVFIGLAAIYLYTSPIIMRKIGFFGGIAALLFSILFLVLACIGATRMASRNKAVVTSQSVILSTAPRTPRDRNEEVALLHEGSSLKVIDSLTSTTDTIGSGIWYKVELDSDHKGWAPATSLEII